MIHSAFFIAIYFLITTFSCTAMEQQAKILAEITCVEKPWYAVWLDGDEVVVSGANGASICNYRKNTEIKKICDFQNNKAPWLIDHPNKEKIAFSNLKGNVVIYDTKTKKTWDKKSQYNNPCVLNPQVLNPSMMDVYMDGNSIHAVQLPEDTSLHAFHPTQPLCLVSYERDYWKSNIETCASNGGPLENKITFQRNNVTHGCCYSGDGSLIAVRNAGNINVHTDLGGISIIDLTTHKEQNLPSGSDHPFINDMVFHPNSFILAGLSRGTRSTKSFSVYYWNTKTHQLITVTEVCENPNSYSYCGRRIDVSDDGTKLIIVTENRCFIVEVPLEAICKNKDQAIFNCWALQQYQQNQRNDIPDELLRVLQQTVFECSKYSFTNY